MHTLIKTIQSWMDHQEMVYRNSGMMHELKDETPIRSLPVWPTRGQLKRWVEELKPHAEGK